MSSILKATQNICKLILLAILKILRAYLLVLHVFLDILYMQKNKKVLFTYFLAQSLTPCSPLKRVSVFAPISPALLFWGSNSLVQHCFLAHQVCLHLLNPGKSKKYQYQIQNIKSFVTEHFKTVTKILFSSRWRICDKNNHLGSQCTPVWVCNKRLSLSKDQINSLQFWKHILFIRESHFTSLKVIQHVWKELQIFVKGTITLIHEGIRYQTFEMGIVFY